MSRDRVNPITSLVHRLSKTLSLNRNSFTNEDSDECSNHPRGRLSSVTEIKSDCSFEVSQKRDLPARSASACPGAYVDTKAELESNNQNTEDDMEIQYDEELVTPVEGTDGSDSSEEPLFTYSGNNLNQIYEFDYPEIPRNESDSNLMSSARRSDFSEGSLSTDIDDGEISRSEEEVEQSQSTETEPHKTRLQEKENASDANEQEAHREICQEDYDSYSFPQFEVEHDPEQDPFHEAALVAESHQFSHPPRQPMGTSPPAILVTSPSNNDISKKSPSRPPPPVLKPVRPPLPPPPSHPLPKEVPPQPSAQPSPRPTSSPESPSPLRKKKLKIFGLNIGK
ncbi:unnamed protein product [Mesocestoides corti]|uniref:WH2 domain-containing protein n=1 Tax=Mesocestoides corti TaxID=53468 RepID=A0A0R3UBB7_MESCO|nr:unnamed protein product [Mesocestoides corti]